MQIDYLANLPALFGTLLTIQITMLGILLAAVFVYVQLIATQFTHRATSLLLHDKSLALFIFIDLSTVALSTIALVAVSVKWFANISLPEFAHAYLGTTVVEFIPRARFVTVLLFLTILSGVLFVGALIRYAQYTDAAILVQNLSRKVSNQALFRHLLYRVDQANIGPYSEQKLSPFPRFVAYLKNVIDRNSASERSIDPLSPVFDIAVSAILRHDHIAWQQALQQVMTLACRLNQSGKLSPKFLTEHQAKNNIAGNELATYIHEHIRFLSEVAIENGHPSLLADIVGMLGQLIHEFTGSKPNWFAATELLAALEAIGVDRISAQDDITLRKTLDVFEYIGLKMLQPERIAAENELAGTSKDLFNRCCKIIGIFGERAVLRGSPIQTLMPSTNRAFQSTILDDIFNLLGQVNQGIIDLKIKFYPLIYIDALDVIARRLFENVNTLNNPESDLVHIASSVFDLASHAIELGDEHTLNLIAIHLLKMYRAAKTAAFSWTELTADIAEYLAHLGAKAAIKNLPITDVSVIGLGTQGLPNDQSSIVSARILEINLADLTPAMFEVFMKSLGHDLDKTLEYIKQIGKLKNSNFGLHFDPQTGEDLPTQEE